MNYIKEAEHYLWHYRDLKNSLENMQKERDKLIQENGPRDITSVKLDITGVSGSSKQDNVINTLFKIKDLTQSIKETEQKLNEINVILDSMDIINADLLRRWYIQKQPKENIANDLGYSISQIYRLKDKAIKNFAIQIHGIKAINYI